MRQQVKVVEVMYNEGSKAKQYIVEDVELRIEKHWVIVVHDAWQETWFPQSSVCFISFELPGE